MCFLGIKKNGDKHTSISFIKTARLEVKKFLSQNLNSIQFLVYMYPKAQDLRKVKRKTFLKVNSFSLRVMSLNWSDRLNISSRSHWNDGPKFLWLAFNLKFLFFQCPMSTYLTHFWSYQKVPPSNRYSVWYIAFAADVPLLTSRLCLPYSEP